MTLNQLISKATKLSQRFTTGDIPIYVDGWEVDIDLKDVGENGDYRIIMEVNKKPMQYLLNYLKTFKYIQSKKKKRKEHLKKYLKLLLYNSLHHQNSVFQHPKQ